MTSIIITSYKRADLLKQCLDTLHQTIDSPCEIIVNCDGGDTAFRIALQYWLDKKISKLILNNGDNRGIGRGFQNCLGVAEGEYIFKVDSDIIFTKPWLAKAIQCLQSNRDIGALGLFDYNRQDPNDERFKPENNVIEKRKDCLIVKDFVSSIYGFRKKDLDNWSGNIPDDGLHQFFQKEDRTRYLGLLDLVDNKAFGFGSVYVTIKPDGTAFKTPTYELPLIFGKNP